MRDVTERHQLREELRMHNQHLEQLVQERAAKIAQLEEHCLRMEKLAAMGQMAAGVAHEVNKPLAGIRNAFALFKSSLTEDDENYQLLELIDSEIDRISDITRQMYQLYRPSQQQATTFDLERTIAGVVALLQPQATKSNVRVDVITGQCQPAEQLDSTQVELRGPPLALVVHIGAKDESQQGRHAFLRGRTPCQPALPCQVGVRSFTLPNSIVADRFRMITDVSASVAHTTLDTYGVRCLKSAVMMKWCSSPGLSSQPRFWEWFHSSRFWLCITSVVDHSTLTQLPQLEPRIPCFPGFGVRSFHYICFWVIFEANLRFSFSRKICF